MVRPGNVQVFAVGGGGAGGLEFYRGYAGGGGAGGYYLGDIALYDTATITIGSGGAAKNYTDSQNPYYGTNGGDTKIDIGTTNLLTCLGGAYGDDLIAGSAGNYGNGGGGSNGRSGTGPAFYGVQSIAISGSSPTYYPGFKGGDSAFGPSAGAGASTYSDGASDSNFMENSGPNSLPGFKDSGTIYYGIGGHGTSIYSTYSSTTTRFPSSTFGTLWGAGGDAAEQTYTGKAGTQGIVVIRYLY